MTKDSRYKLAADGDRLQRIERLVRQYPEIDAAERDEILHFIRKGPRLDAGLLTGIDGIKPQLDRFRADHRAQLGLGMRDYAMVGVIMLVLAAFVSLLWNAGLKG